MFEYRISGDVIMRDGDGQPREAVQIIKVPNKDPVDAFAKFFELNPDYVNDYQRTVWDEKTKGLEHAEFRSAANRDIVLDVNFEDPADAV